MVDALLDRKLRQTEKQNSFKFAPMKLRRTNSNDPDFGKLAAKLEAELQIRDGINHAALAEINMINKLDYVVLAYRDYVPVACGGLRPFNDQQMEVKRMYVAPVHRGNGYGTAVLSELEKWAKELGYIKCILETGKNQPEAIQLYQKHGYKLIANFGPYKDNENSVCFEKTLTNQL